MKKVNKAWGYELWWADVPGKYLGKILHINKGHRFSLQYHKKKDESMYILKGVAELDFIPESSTDYKHPGLIKKVGDCIFIPHQTIHRITAIEDLDIIEVSSYYPDDVVRLQDDYGRI